MKFKLNDQEINVIIIRKKTNKNTYLRVKDDLSIYITTNYFTKEKDLLRLIENNQKSILKMINKINKKRQKQEEFYYLGNKYDIIILNNKDIILGSDKIFIKNKDMLDKWLKKQALIIFKDELNKIYKDFPLKIPYPTLTIRSMKTRWGVCNVKTKRVTLNLELIKKDIKYLDYVIVHELSHLVYPNHSKEFWNLVESVLKDYKKLRKELNNYE